MPTSSRSGRLVVKRLDQGVDVQGRPGQVIRAPVRARVDAVKNDPGGFGKAVYFTLLSGNRKGQQVYVGHARPRVRAGQTIAAGAPVAQLLKQPLGNATKPGWAEIGFAAGGAPAGEQTAPSALAWLKKQVIGGGGAPASSNTSPRTGGKLNFNQLAALWVRAGGPQSVAAIAAAIALAESGGDPTAHNNNPSSGDDSWGLWQINYYGKLRANRTKMFGPPEGLRDPLANARAAVALYKHRGDFNDWSTYKNGLWQGPYTTNVGRLPPGWRGDTPVIPIPGVGAVGEGAAAGETAGAGARGFGRWRPGGLVAGGAAAGVLSGAVDTASFLSAALWLVDARNWLRLVEFITGAILMLFGFAGLAAIFLARTDTAQAVSSSARDLPGPTGTLARGAHFLGRPKQALRAETSRRRTATRRDELAERRRQRQQDEEHYRDYSASQRRERDAERARAREEQEQRIADIHERAAARRATRDNDIPF